MESKEPQAKEAKKEPTEEVKKQPAADAAVPKAAPSAPTSVPQATSEKVAEKKKRKKKKKAKTATDASGKPAKEEEKKKADAAGSKIEDDKTKIASRSQDNSIFRVLGNWKEGEYKQTVYPMIPIESQFPDGKFPMGVVCEYKEPYSHRMADQEAKDREVLLEPDYQCYRKAAECHRQVRRFAQSIVRPGKTFMSMVTEIENAIRRLIKANKSEAGIAFPCGCSVNSCAAHYTPNPGDERVMQQGDVVKIDIGTHYKGCLIDSAFTVALDPTFDNLLLAAKEATNTGIKEAGIDARLDEIGERIQETMESHEVEIKGKIHKVRCVRNLQGHQIGRYKIHYTKAVPTVKGGEPHKMLEGELYAIETFGSTGKGLVFDDPDCSHYMMSSEPKHGPIRNTRSKFLLKLIEENFSTLGFARRWLEEMGFEKHYSALKPLVDAGAVNSYPPLSDIPGSYVAQFEHTFLLRPTGKEILSAGDDYQLH